MRATMRDQSNHAHDWSAQQRRTTGENLLADDTTYKAEYVGSGTFIISKPKRKKIKVRQTALRNPRRGSRK